MYRAMILSAFFTAVISVLVACQPQGKASSAHSSTEPADNASALTEKQDLETHSKTLKPSATPEETLTQLYSDKVFFRIRNRAPQSAIQHLISCFTPELKKQLERHEEDVSRWLTKNKDSGLKLPVSAGPIFLSNYEGADSFAIGKATVSGELARVNIAFSINDVTGSFEWTNVAILRHIDDVWLLDNIEFESNDGVPYTLRDRVSLIE